MKHKKSEVTRAKIVSAARSLFLEKGIDKTSVAEICRISGVSNGALFHQFKVKEDIAFAVFSEVRVEFWDRVISAMVVHDDPHDGIEAAVRASFAFQREEPGAAAFMSDVNASEWIARYADDTKPFYDIGVERGLAWAVPHVQAGRIPAVSPDAFIALVAGAPQWIGRVIRIGLAGSTLDSVADDLALCVRRAFTIR
ncbi:TetR/AcrR family transcriptional regulator [Novosphingobium sp. TH158]|uniref:TetR/AcrR family transcriptional regulator n=1 Tax=Novosphingobium sp. TH158 TaxID=2067455 RepID=UPI000C7D4ADD|nr:TetR/AcrR family transcriptional regulator [Novosphingobium sp. TH158]PLK24221.1 hypothetical protein C0V78_13150 [Novosphingobium sp. TH158]